MDDHQDLLVMTRDFPRRRSSYLVRSPARRGGGGRRGTTPRTAPTARTAPPPARCAKACGRSRQLRRDHGHAAAQRARQQRLFVAGLRVVLQARSDEHTSELPSLMRISYAVFCLKKKTNTYQQSIYY